MRTELKVAIQSFQLDPNAASYTDDEIVTKINNASNQITRAGSVAAAARPIAAGEVGDTELGSFTVTNTELASGAAKANLDAMSDTARGYVKTAPASGQFPVVAVQRAASGELEVDYDDVAI